MNCFQAHSMHRWPQWRSIACIENQCSIQKFLILWAIFIQTLKNIKKLGLHFQNLKHDFQINYNNYNSPQSSPAFFSFQLQSTYLGEFLINIRCCILTVVNWSEMSLTFFIIDFSVAVSICTEVGAFWNWLVDMISPSVLFCTSASLWVKNASS